jgi:hypothetical protein
MVKLLFQEVAIALSDYGICKLVNISVTQDKVMMKQYVVYFTALMEKLLFQEVEIKLLDNEMLQLVNK